MSHLSYLCLCCLIISDFQQKYVVLKAMRRSGGISKNLLIKKLKSKVYVSFLICLYEGYTVDECINAGSLHSKWLFWLFFRKFGLNPKILLQTDSNSPSMAQDIFQINFLKNSQIRQS